MGFPSKVQGHPIDHRARPSGSPRELPGRLGRGHSGGEQLLKAASHLLFLPLRDLLGRSGDDQGELPPGAPPG